MEPRVRRGDALLELAHLGGQGRLVADGARHAAQEGGDLGAGLREAEDVVDEEEDVLALVVAEVLGDGERGQAHAGAGAGRLVHLAVDERAWLLPGMTLNEPLAFLIGWPLSSFSTAMTPDSIISL